MNLNGLSFSCSRLLPRISQISSVLGLLELSSELNPQSRTTLGSHPRVLTLPSAAALVRMNSDGECQKLSQQILVS